MASKGKETESSQDATPTNPRGIPYAPFVDKVEDYVTTRDDVEPTLRSFQEMISKYQFMEMNLQKRMGGLKEKIPDIQKTLDSVKFLKLRKDDDEAIDTTFELNDTLYSKAKIPATEEVYIWLGANVMLSYPIDEAETLLSSKLSTAKTSLSNCEEDLDFLREQITTMEVAIARVYNWEVVQKRKDKVEEEQEKKRRLDGLEAAIREGRRSDEQQTHPRKYQRKQTTSGTLGWKKENIGADRPQTSHHVPNLEVSEAADRERRRTHEYRTTDLREPIERKLRMQKRWTDESPAAMLRKYLAQYPPSRETQLKVANIRSLRLPIILIQMHLKRQFEANKMKNVDLGRALPSPQQWESLMGLLEHNGHRKAELNLYHDILFGRSDEERCKLFLADLSPKPVFILLYLLRFGSGISELSTLEGLMEYVRKRLRTTADKTRQNAYDEGRSRAAMETIASEDFVIIMERLAFHCRRVEPRRLTLLAEITAEFITRFEAKSGIAEETYYARCKFFNATLGHIASRMGSGPQKYGVPSTYLWEALRILLRMSGGLPEALLVDRNGFQAIRAVLAGMPKNRDDMRNARRQSKTWPPYLRPEDGIDEAMEPEESWSRVVRAGMMMQEAGFPRNEVDVALDILQGLGQDGTPTIQQRTSLAPGREPSVWAASIKATRNAHEAWKQFNNPPKAGMEPKQDEYAAMFQKLYAREADPTKITLPGDNTLNYDTHEETNLTELEKLRLQPPSPQELFEVMKQSKVKLNEQCLCILVSNAAGLSAAHEYLMAGSTQRHNYDNLIAPQPAADMLRNIPLPVFSAYTSLLAKIPHRKGQHLIRAIRLVELRLGRNSQNWGSWIWSPIIKTLSQHHSTLKVTFEAQLRLVIYLADRINNSHGMTLYTFRRLTKAVRKILSYKMNMLAAAADADTLELNPLNAIYDRREAYAKTEKAQDLLKNSAVPMVRTTGARIKSFFYSLVIKEREGLRVEENTHLSALDRMRARGDPVMATYAHDLMLALAYTGEFGEMAELMKWLVREWSSPRVQEEMENMDEMPPDMDMMETLCAFRAFAEPMLPQSELARVRDNIVQSSIWDWPGDAVVLSYIEEGDVRGNQELRTVLEWVCARPVEEAVEVTDIEDLDLDWTATEKRALEQELDNQQETRRIVLQSG
ncbi:prefoldin subunit [Fusarium heterosporum]|uniref:Prefoldin subunit n=1 Tax=Fusarium heterosporum TaxID=42747 RepID=A0A8H5WIS0_FUSHE|nr:prefoldin subunit [Fusarium heterosporum]